ncbi:MAG: GNAT family N-acetyltransferase [Paracoccaceae bacterium]
MSIEITSADPRSPEALALLQASHDLMNSLYPPEHNHYLSVDELCIPSIHFVVARLNGEAKGCAALSDQTTYGELKSMFVAPETRGSGLGAALMDHLESVARASGLAAIKLETGDTLDAAHRLYARHGFVICGPFGAYVEGPHSVFMEKQLA